MAPKIINLTLLVATEEVEGFLEVYFKYACQISFSMPEIRQKLINYITARSRDRYIVVNHTEKPSGKLDFPNSHLEQQLHIETLIHKGIRHITRNASPSGNAMGASHFFAKPFHPHPKSLSLHGRGI